MTEYIYRCVCSPLPVLHHIPSSPKMTDRFFPSEPPSEQALHRLLRVQYELGQVYDERYLDVHVSGWDLEAGGKARTIRVPARYHGHLLRSFWRRKTFVELFTRYNALFRTLVVDPHPLLLRHIMYIDGMVQGLLTTAQKHKRMVPFRSALFDLYLVVEYFVGRHQSNQVSHWRYAHPDIILECQDVQTLGACIPISERCKDHKNTTQTGIGFIWKRTWRIQSGLV